MNQQRFIHCTLMQKKVSHKKDFLGGLGIIVDVHGNPHKWSSASLGGCVNDIIVMRPGDF